MSTLDQVLEVRVCPDSRGLTFAPSDEWLRRVPHPHHTSSPHGQDVILDQVAAVQVHAHRVEECESPADFGAPGVIEVVDTLFGECLRQQQLATAIGLLADHGLLDSEKHVSLVSRPAFREDDGADSYGDERYDRRRDGEPCSLPVW